MFNDYYISNTVNYIHMLIIKIDRKKKNKVRNLWKPPACNVTVMTLEGVTKRTEHHGYSIGMYLQEQRMLTRT